VCDRVCRRCYIALRRCAGLDRTSKHKGCTTGRMRPLCRARMKRLMERLPPGTTPIPPVFRQALGLGSTPVAARGPDAAPDPAAAPGPGESASTSVLATQDVSFDASLCSFDLWFGIRRLRDRSLNPPAHGMETETQLVTVSPTLLAAPFHPPNDEFIDDLVMLFDCSETLVAPLGERMDTESQLATVSPTPLATPFDPQDDEFIDYVGDLLLPFDGADECFETLAARLDEGMDTETQPVTISPAPDQDADWAAMLQLWGWDEDCP